MLSPSERSQCLQQYSWSVVRYYYWGTVFHYEGLHFYFKNADYNFSFSSFMTCDVRNCVYVLECAGGFKYYIGETNKLRLRINLHKDHTRKNSGLDVSKYIFDCTKNKLNGHNFRIMHSLKLKNMVQHWEKCMRSILLVNWNQTSTLLFQFILAFSFIYKAVPYMFNLITLAML